MSANYTGYIRLLARGIWDYWCDGGRPAAGDEGWRCAWRGRATGRELPLDSRIGCFLEDQALGVGDGRCAWQSGEKVWHRPPAGVVSDTYRA